MIRLAQAEVRVGERLSGNAAWPAGDGVILLAWRVEGDRSDWFPNVVGERRHAPGGAPVPFEFGIPHDGPVSYDGKLFRVVWEVAVRAAGQVEIAPVRVVPRRLDPGHPGHAPGSAPGPGP